jgi:superfamily II DNA or RNA helicase
MLSKFGFYVIPKESLDKTASKKLVNDLTLVPVVKPFQKSTFKVKPKPIKLIMESTKFYYLPRFYGLNNFGIPRENHLLDGADISVEFNGSLYPDQMEPVGAVLEKLREPYLSGGILSLPCGEGKTVSSIYIISQIKKKTIIVVHKEFLMNQWKEEINTFLPGAKIGYIQGSLYNVENVDIVIGMIQTMAKREYEYKDFCQFGLSIYDECHHLGARLFSKVLQKIPSKCILGLSAEPIRKDGMNLVFEYSLGKVIFQRERQHNDQVQVYNYLICSRDKRFECVFDASGNKLLYKMEENVVSFPKRNEFIVFLLKKLFSADTPFSSQRQILVLSARNDGHLPLLYQLLCELAPGIKVGFYVGRNGMNKKKHQEILDNARNCQIILGSYDMAQEGLNIKSLNSIMLASPLVGLQNQVIHGEKKEFCNDIKQTIGRILRDKHSDVPRIVIDLTDCFGNYIEWSRQRNKYYIKEQYNVSKIRVDLDSFNITDYEQDKFNWFCNTSTLDFESIEDEEQEPEEEEEEEEVVEEPEAEEPEPKQKKTRQQKRDCVRIVTSEHESELGVSPSKKKCMFRF